MLIYDDWLIDKLSCNIFICIQNKITIKWLIVLIVIYNNDILYFGSGDSSVWSRILLVLAIQIMFRQFDLFCSHVPIAKNWENLYIKSSKGFVKTVASQQEAIEVYFMCYCLHFRSGVMARPLFLFSQQPTQLSTSHTN